MQKKHFYYLHIIKQGKSKRRSCLCSKHHTIKVDKGLKDKSSHILNPGSRLGRIANFMLQPLYPRKEYYKSDE